jgi:S-adenosylmethionine-dependent methyltransferase
MEIFMTDYKKIIDYYNQFDEWSRLDTPEGKLEFLILTDILGKYIKSNSTILDLGGGPGRYSIFLSKMNNKIFLADISPKLIDTAKHKIKQANVDKKISCDVINALDLSKYNNEQFDYILLFGPLYHLKDNDEREKCISEVRRVLKINGTVFSIYIPKITGAAGIMERMFYAPDQVNITNFIETFKSGEFSNNSINGFQEGFFTESNTIEELFVKKNFRIIENRSIRSIGYRNEKNIIKLLVNDKYLFNKIIELINQYSNNKSIIDTSGHALLVCEKIR